MTRLQLFCLLVWSFACQFANGLEPARLAINCDEVEYNGNEILLQGDVTVEHALGKIAAKQFSILSNESSHKFSSSILKIQEDIHIDFQGGGHLICEQAEIDYEKLYGHFFGTLCNPDVLFQLDQVSKSQPSVLNLTIRAPQLQIWFINHEGQEQSKSKPLFDYLKFDNHVRINYQDQFDLTADQAVYQVNPKQLPDLRDGKIFLTSKPNEYCQLTSKVGDLLSAETITIDTLSRTIYLQNVQGFLTDHKEGIAQKIEFSADALMWKSFENYFILSGHVNVNESNKMYLRTPHSLEINYKQVNGKNEIQSIFIPKDIQLEHKDLETQSLRTVTSPGSLLLNHETFLLQINSPENAEGVVLDKDQIVLMDARGEMKANQLQIQYAMPQNKSFEAQTIFLQGNVQVFNQGNNQTNKNLDILQYALADELEYQPHSQEIVLKAQEGNRVLFFDKINGVQMSAPGLKIHHDSMKRKDTVQGIGDVHFTFVEKELEQLKKRFHLSKKSDDHPNR